MLQKIASIVLEAGKIIMDDSSLTIEQKSNLADFLTNKDVAVQHFLINALKALLPEAGFLGEEGAQSDLDHEYLFIIDPIDGTANLVHDCKKSAISVALMQNGKALYAVAYNPYANELFTAERGCGAYLNGKPIRVTDMPLESSLVAVGTSPYVKSLADKTFHILKRVYEISADLRRGGSAVIDICDVACGRYALMYELCIFPWDYSAARLIVEEAGGVFCYLDGKEHAITDKVAIALGTPEAMEKFKEACKDIAF